VRGSVAHAANGLASQAAVELRAATAFLSRFPVGSPGVQATGAAAFGLVGGLIGLVGALVLIVLGGQAPLAAGGLAVAAVAVVSGGLHLDGLADTADALAAPTAEAATRARRDPRVGAAGAAAVAVAVVVDASLLAAIIAGADPSVAALSCLVAAAGSRALAPGLAAIIRKGAPRDVGRGAGVGAWFVDRATTPAALLAAASAGAIATGAAVIASRPALLVALAGGTILTLAAARWLAWARGGLDGDGFGALVEIAFTAILLVTVLGL
jgi:adenosylcobinamide-GDP ribazoletransferase